MTLLELIEEHGWGKWLAKKQSPHKKCFKPLAKSELEPEMIIGELDPKDFAYITGPVWFNEKQTHWVLWTEIPTELPKPKEKIKRWKWAYKHIRQPGWGESTLFLSEEEKNNALYGGLRDAIKIPYSEMEFDE